jgi:hypothetical protein
MKSNVDDECVKRDDNGFGHEDDLLLTKAIVINQNYTTNKYRLFKAVFFYLFYGQNHYL